MFVVLVSKSCPTLCDSWTVSPRLLCLWDFSGKNLGVDCHFLLQGIFLTQGSNTHLHWQVDSLPLSYLGSPGPKTTLFSSVQSLSHVRLFATPWTAACQASLSITNCRSLPKSMSIELVMPSNHLILCRLLLLLPSIFPSIRVFSNESALRLKWPKYWSFSFNISPSNKHLGLISSRMDWLNLLAVQGTLNTTAQKHKFFSIQLSL